MSGGDELLAVYRKERGVVSSNDDVEYDFVDSGELEGVCGKVLHCR
jgi:hypothetical protein